MIKNGPARLFSISHTFTPGTPEFMVHNLSEGIPRCGFESQFKFTGMIVKLNNIKPWKLCPECFKVN